MLPGRLIIDIKSILDGKTKYKAQYIISGQKDNLKSRMVHVAATIQLPSFRLLLALAAIFGFKIWTAYITQAYLKFTKPLSRNI